VASSVTAASSSAAKATAPTPVGAIGATSSQAGSSAAAAPADSGKGGEKSGDKSGAPKTGFTGSVAVGLVTLDGEQVTRVSLRPEFSVGPLGIALDLELFIASDGRFKTTGWEFNTNDETYNSLYRKIYYLRWNQPGDKFYARVGALEGITMDAAGLVTSGYGNVANYPGQKLVGTHIQLNNWLDPWGISLEVVNNSYQDWNKNGGVLGGKLSGTPLGITALPIIKGLKIGVMGIRDFNQLASIPDKDRDNCPDQVDDINGSGCKYASSMDGYNQKNMENMSGTDSAWLAWRGEQKAYVATADSQIQDRFGKADDFTMISLDYLLPIFKSAFFSVDVYGEWARPWLDDQADPMNLNSTYGLVPLGVAVKVWKLDLGLEYRRLKGQFQVGNFNAAYEMERVRFMDGEYQTKEQTYWNAAADNGISQGVYGRAGMDVFGAMQVNGSYYYLKGADHSNDQGYTAKAGVGKNILNMVPKIALVEAFYNKEHLYTDGDDFFERSIYTTYGYRVGFNLGGGMTVIMGNFTTFSRDENGKLVPASNFVAETVITF
jgi:hypothetical protein